MLIFRNPEMKKLSIIYLIFTICAALGVIFFSPIAAIYVFVICTFASIIFLVSTKKRYNEISKLSYNLDEILHGNENINLLPDKEGELAVLSSEIYKMTIRLREQSELLQKEKTYLSDSLANISHQIRTPLTSIRMIVPRFRKADLTEESRYEYVREINNLLSKMEWLTTALLKISKLESDTVIFQKEPIVVSELINKALSSLEIFLEIKEISLSVNIEPNSSFNGDFLWTVEAVGNILKNCIEHTPIGGELNIYARENPLYTEIIISDTGLGIAPEDLPHLFQRFYKGKDSGIENVGIGLALSRMIISRQNGTIKAVNSKKQGAEFHIRFYKGTI